MRLKSDLEIFKVEFLQLMRENLSKMEAERKSDHVIVSSCSISWSRVCEFEERERRERTTFAVRIF